MLYQLSYYRKKRYSVNLFLAYPKLRKPRADRGTRTPDPRITNALLYQLSHIGIVCKTGAKVIVFFETTKFSSFLFAVLVRFRNFAQFANKERATRE
jgi:hypothetical protein